jgi:hypothetical protein
MRSFACLGLWMALASMGCSAVGVDPDDATDASSHPEAGEDASGQKDGSPPHEGGVSSTDSSMDPQDGDTSDAGASDGGDNDAGGDDAGVYDGGLIDPCLGVFCTVGKMCCNNPKSINYGKCVLSITLKC